MKLNYRLLIIAFLLLNISQAQTYLMQNSTEQTCTGMFYDSQGESFHYDHNEDIAQTFCSTGGEKLLVVFDDEHFRINKFDTLFIYDGALTMDPLIASYTNYALPDSILSSGSCLTFRFKSDDSGSAEGWEGSISCTSLQQLGPQDYTLSDGERVICDGNLMSLGGDRTMSFYSKNGNRLSIDIQSLSLGNHVVPNVSSTYDYLYIYDGPSPQYPLLHKLRKNENPGKVTSSGSALCFVFDDNAANSSSISATFSCEAEGPLPNILSDNSSSNICNAVLYDNGGPLSDMNKSGEYFQSICSDNGKHVLVRFNPNIKIGEGDELIIYDGADTLSQPLAIYTRNSIFDSIQSTGTCLTFHYRSNTSNIANFQAWVSCRDVPLQLPQAYIISEGMRYVCDARLYDHEGVGNMNHAYGYTDKSTVFVSNKNNRIQVDFNSFSIPFNSFYSDVLRVWDYNTHTEEKSLIGSYTKNNSPGVVVSNWNAILFEYDAKASLHSGGSFTGWDADVSCVDNDVPDIGDTTFVVAPNAPNASFIGQFLISDLDVHQNHTLEIISGNDNGIFTVDSTGAIYVFDNTNLNIGFATSHVLEIQVMDNSIPIAVGIGFVTINLLCDPVVAPVLNSEENFCQGDDVLITAVGQGPSLSYQWHTDDNPILSQTSATLSIEGAQLVDDGKTITW